MLSASTLTLRGVIQTGAGGPVAYRNSGFYPAFGTASDGESLTGEVLQFDPATMTILNTISIPAPLGENLEGYGQIASRGTEIYIPYNFFYECICIETDRGNPPSNPPPVQGIAVINTEKSTLVANLPIASESVYGFAIPAGSNYGYLSTEVNEAPELIQINLETGKSVQTVAAGGVGNLLSSPDGTTLYLNASSGLYAIDAQTLATTNSAGLSYKAFSITPDGQYLYCAEIGQVDIVSTASLRVVGVIPAPAASDHAPTPGAPIMVSR